MKVEFDDIWELINGRDRIESIEFFEKNKSYCSLPFSHVYSDSAGRYRLCCHSWHTSKFQKDENGKHKKINPLMKYNTREHTPFEVLFSREMDEIRNKMTAGEIVDTCEKCTMLETRGAISPRMEKTQRHKDYFGHLPLEVEPHTVQIKLRIFGNNCNLSCYMCAPFNSSTRKKELKEANIDKEQQKYFGLSTSNFDAGIKKDQAEKILQNVLDNIHYVHSIQITGGEPFLLPRHYSFLDSIPEKYAQNIDIRYDTNLTNLEYKGKSIFETLKKFKSFEFMVSADHYGEKLKYIRYPIDVDQFERNLDYVQTKYSAIKRIGVAVSMLNVEDLDEILPYYENKFGIKNTGYSNTVLDPNMLAIQHHIHKEKLIKKYRDWSEDINKLVIKNLQEPQDIVQWNRAIEYLEKLDAHRGTDFRKLWPEYDYIETIKCVNL